MSGAYEELLETGALGTEGARLLYRTVEAVARFDRYPPPRDHSSWTADAVAEVAHDFLSGDRSTERLIQLAVLASDDRSFARLMESAVRNFFRSEARATERGRLFRRIKSLLEEHDEFIQVSGGRPGAGWWWLRGGTATPWTGRIDELLLAASQVELQVVRWREGPIADRTSLRALCTAILTAAEGSVSIQDVVGVAAIRLGLGRPPLVVSIDTSDFPGPSDIESESIEGIAASVIFDQLSDRERLLLLVMDEPVRDAGSFVGISKSSAASGLNRLREKLRILLPDSDNRLGTLRQLTELISNWSETWTDSGGSASKGG